MLYDHWHTPCDIQNCHPTIWPIRLLEISALMAKCSLHVIIGVTRCYWPWDQRQNKEQRFCLLLEFISLDRSTSHFPLRQTWRLSISILQLAIRELQYFVYTRLFPFYLTLTRYARDCSSRECFILRAMWLSKKLLKQGFYIHGKFEILIYEFLWSIRG